MTTIFSYLRSWRFRRRIASLHAELGIPRDYARRRALPPQPEARGLVVVGPDIYDREQRLLAPAAAAWHAMVEAAARDGVELQPAQAGARTAHRRHPQGLGGARFQRTPQRPRRGRDHARLRRARGNLRG